MKALLSAATFLLLTFVRFEPNVAKPTNNESSTTTTTDESSTGSLGDALNGVPMDNGHLSGSAELAWLNWQEEHKQPSLDEDLHEGEIEVAFLTWLEEFEAIGKPPHTTPMVEEYMQKHNLTIDSVRTMYDIKSGAQRRKRSAAIGTSGIWTKCIIPYTVDDSISDLKKSTVRSAIKLYEKETGFRFYPYNNSNAAMGLGHTNYLKFESGCHACLGNKNWTGQHSGACNSLFGTAHELGHSFGMAHEQNAAGNWPFLDVHYKETTRKSIFFRRNLGQMYQSSKSYDISSNMHYNYWSHKLGYVPVFHTMDLDFMYGSMANTYYSFKAIQEHNKCYDWFDPCPPLPTCEWDGYPSIIDGKCQCRCPEGLDPATGCVTAKPTPPSPAWPKGKYSFLKTNVGPCPEGFETGTMYNNPAWDVWDDNKYHIDKFDADEYAHNVCTKTEEGTGEPWPAGQYCIHRYGGTCPYGFESATVDTYGEVPKGQDVGAVPDGKHGQLFEYVFCCRDDGDIHVPITLPSESAFILYRAKSASTCQDVEGMLHEEEKYYLRTNVDAFTPNWVGSLPNIYEVSKYRFYVYYCAYIPALEHRKIKTFAENEKIAFFATPNYPNNYPIAEKYTWYFRSPEGSRMQLDFLDFEISHATDADCETYVRVYSFRPGTPGFWFCGHNYQKTHWTYTNYLTVDFISDLSPTQTGFNASVRVIAAEDKCYTGDGRDRSYAGKVTYDKSFSTCVPWSQVTHCPFHMFDTRFVDNDLAEHNYCRNIGIAGQPWCYYNVESCLRQNCDACMTGSCFDLFDDCQALIAADSNYCSNSPYDEATRACKKSCGICDKHVPIAPATCGAPPKVKGVTPTPAAESYKVGDVVTYKCPTGTDWRESVCTSEGKWTELNFICGACPSGWAAWKGKCYKYLDWDTNVDYPTAVSICKKLNAHVIQVDSKEKQTFMDSLVGYYYETNYYAWIGLTKDDVGKWVWPDGSQYSWNLFASGQPDNVPEEKCVINYGSNWHDQPCSNKAEVVCEYEPTGPFSCEDQLSNCDAVISTTPDVCKAYPDYAWANCRKSCAVGDCGSTGVTCNDDAKLGDTGSRTAGADTVDAGQQVKYNCAEGYVLISGSLTRTCLPSGSLSGSAPVCANSGDREMVLFDKPYIITSRDERFIAPYTYLTPEGSMTFPVSGKVISWTFYSHVEGGEIAFQMFRPFKDPLKNLSLTFLGENRITSLPDRRIHKVEIPDAEQVAVQKGDMYGIWVSGKELSYGACDSERNPTALGWMWPNTVVSEIGSVYNFTKSGVKCRVFGATATLKPYSAG